MKTVVNGSELDNLEAKYLGIIWFRFSMHNVNDIMKFIINDNHSTKR